MKPIRRLLTLAVIGAAGAATWGVGSSLVKDVQFARAEEDVKQTRESLKTLDDLSTAFKKVNHALEPSVVQLIVTKKIEAAGGMGPNFEIPPNMRRFFDRDGDGMPDMPEEGPDAPEGPKEQATGSGVIMNVENGEGFIVTNNHVVSDAVEVTVVLSDGRRIEDAKVLGTDPKSDVAAVRIKADRLIAAKWGDSDTLEKGDIIVAFGSPFGYVGSMSHGIVSALNRQAGVISSRYAYENFIQVDASINPGNSGGPLVNLHGEVVGINTAIASRTGSFAGIGFAIPSNQAKTVYESLKTNGKVVRGYLGVQIADVKTAQGEVKEQIDTLGFKGESGVYVSQIPADSPARNIVKPGDVITEIDGKPISNMTELRNKIAVTAPGTEVKLTVWRDAKSQQVSVKLAEQPEQLASAGGMGPGGNGAVPGVTGLGLTVVTPTADDLESAGLPADTKGALVKNLNRASPAARAGIRPGDVITRIGDADIKNAEDAKKALTGIDIAKGVRIDLVNREGQRMVTIRNRANQR